MRILDQQPVIIPGTDNPNFVAAAFDGNYVIVVDRKPGEYPRDAFTEYCRGLTEWKKKVGTIRLLIACTLSRGPSTTQRKELAAVSANSDDLWAVLTDSVMTRAVAQVFSTAFATRVRVFAPSDLKGAAQYLGLDATPAEIQKKIDELRRIPALSAAR